MLSCCSGWGGPTPTGDALKSPVEHASELSLEMSWNQGVLLHDPHSALVEDRPWGLASQFCSQANALDAGETLRPRSSEIQARIEMGSCPSARNRPPQVQVVLEVGHVQHLSSSV